MSIGSMMANEMKVLRFYSVPQLAMITQRKGCWCKFNCKCRNNPCWHNVNDTRHICWCGNETKAVLLIKYDLDSQTTQLPSGFHTILNKLNKNSLNLLILIVCIWYSNLAHTDCTYQDLRCTGYLIQSDMKTNALLKYWEKLFRIKCW